MKSDIDAGLAVSPAPPSERTGTLAGKPERVAWLVIWSSFFVCVLLTITVPLFVRQFMLYAVEPRASTLQAISLTQASCGTVRLTPPNAQQPSAVTCDPTPLNERSAIETDPSSRAFISFFDGSTAQIFPSSRLVVNAMRQPRFHWSQLPNAIDIVQTQGVVLYAGAPAIAQPSNPDGRPVQIVVHTPQFVATLGEGSYSVEVNGDAAQVVATWGNAVVRTPDGQHEVTLGQGQRLEMAKGQELPEPQPAAQNLLRDTNFEAFKCPPDDATSWRCYFDQGGDGGTTDGMLRVETVADRKALRIVRTDAGNNSAVTGVRQQINRDVSYFRSLVLTADIRVHNQSLSGGGYQSSEYPLIIRLRYRDVAGNEQEYVRGFYYQNDDENPTRNGERIPRDQWIPFQSGNLLQGLDVRPFTLMYIEIYASGWDYESFVSNVRMTVE